MLVVNDRGNPYTCSILVTVTRAAGGGGGGGGAAVTPPLVLATLTEEQIKIKRAAEQKVAALIGQKLTKQ